VGGENFEADWQDFVEQLCDVKRKFGSTQAEVQEAKNKVDPKSIATMLVGGGRNDKAARDRIGPALSAIFRNKGTGGSTIMRAMSKMKVDRRRSSGTPIAALLRQAWNALRVGTPAKESPEQAQEPSDEESGEAQLPVAAQEGLLRESTIDRWQKLAGIKKRV
jgi:hypothetical protein